MGVSGWVIAGSLLIAGFYIVSLYNRLVGLKHGVDKAWANIDVVLKQRHDELPKLVEVCKQYRQFEQDTLERVIAARNQVQSAREAQDVPGLGRAEGQLRAGLGQLFAVAEAYPELRSNEHFSQLLARVSQLENVIADRRELYNESVNLNNVRIELFPDRIVAGWFGFGPRKLLEFAAAEKTDVDLKTLFS
jgi:LemA protein